MEKSSRHVNKSSGMNEPVWLHSVGEELPKASRQGYLSKASVAGTFLRMGELSGGMQRQ